jgi:hypothetical protein
MFLNVEDFFFKPFYSLGDTGNGAIGLLGENLCQVLGEITLGTSMRRVQHRALMSIAPWKIF